MPAALASVGELEKLAIDKLVYYHGGLLYNDVNAKLLKLEKGIRQGRKRQIHSNRRYQAVTLVVDTFLSNTTSSSTFIGLLI
ncbi:hypothetical protein IMPR6_20232 [Imperialibacter sp. EC-SDR9]|nr:hypothetical protein IMPERIA75_420056 [Imperialibacter sp. 75]CAD5294218.1 hypothetical protein IMPERIA89_660054 [Imperialibacter sp. 89]VVT12612.1 hypothetical protein IMPR6_20232 [Imperialibacter sp. EC-SDR9]